MQFWKNCLQFFNLVKSTEQQGVSETEASHAKAKAEEPSKEPEVEDEKVKDVVAQESPIEPEVDHVEAEAEAEAEEALVEPEVAHVESEAEAEEALVEPEIAHELELNTYFNNDPFEYFRSEHTQEKDLLDSDSE